tara:strand:+ start:115 stop:630 length:516 start_codon:yes stop_codon:yes gene_type:complete
MFNTRYKLPTLNLEGRVGITNYIDFINWDEVIYPAMSGTDYYIRDFVVIKFLINRKGKAPEKIMQTFFQRYPGYNDMWMGCGHATPNLIWTDGGIKKEQFEFLNKILNGETLTIPDNIGSPFSGTVSLYDENKWFAAEKIQKQWRLCRYNPQYKMCETIQMRNYETILNES